MAATRILTQECIGNIVGEVGLDAVFDDLITRLASAFATHDGDVVDTMARDGFRYTKPALGLIEWMPAMEAGRLVSIKTVGYHPTNPVERRTPSVLATTSLHDTIDGRLVALCEATFLTAIRTGAASAVVTDVLAREDASALGVVGCGAQAVTQIHAISRVRALQRIVAFDADVSVVATLERRLRRAGIDTPIEVVDDAAAVLAACDILCTVTSVDPGAGPVFDDLEHRPWLHINAVGADLPGKLELPASLVRRATVVPDVLEQCFVEGECQQLRPDQVGPDLVEIVRDREHHAGLRETLTVFDSTGWALEDLIIAEMMIDHAERLDKGVVVDLQPHPRDPYDPYEFLCM
jgi:ornithine cyclodeaminase/alanine dehydrogenase-like protein (mu-crystallin family)